MKSLFKIIFITILMVSYTATIGIGAEQTPQTQSSGFFSSLSKAVTQKVETFWNSIKSKFSDQTNKSQSIANSSNENKFDQKIHTAEKTQITNEGQPTYKGNSSITKTQEITIASRNIASLSLTQDFNLNTLGLKQKKQPNHIVALPAESTIQKSHKKFEVPDEKTLTVILPNDYLKKPAPCIEIQKLELTKINSLDRDELKLLISLIEWLLYPLNVVEGGKQKFFIQNQNVLNTIFQLAQTSKHSSVKQKSFSYAGFIFSEVELNALAATAFSNSILQNKNAENLSTIKYINIAAKELSRLAHLGVLNHSPLAKQLLNSATIDSLLRNKDLSTEALALFYLIKAEQAFDQKNFTQARKMAEQVPSKTSWKEQARFLAATSLLAKNENYQAAGKELTELFRLVEDQQVFDATAVTLGRIHFILGNYKAAHQYLSQVSKETNLYIEATVDNAWALLRSGDRNHAVGNMFTLHTPYFEGAYMPDSYFIQSLGYQEICQFGDAMTAVKQYKQRYNDAFKRIAEFNASGKNSPENYYEELANYLKGKETKLSGIILKELGRHPDFLKRQGVINHVSKDQKNLTSKYPGAVTSIKSWFEDETKNIRSKHKNELQAFMKKRALEIEDELKFLTANIALLEYEIFAGAGQNLALQGAQNFAVDEKEKTKRNYEAGKEYWPYEDEIWEDELNHFRSKMIDSCAKAKQAQT